MTRRVNSTALSPLLDIASNDPEPAVRCAALDTASRLTLSEEGWRTLATTFRAVTGSLPPAAPERATALSLAVRVPLQSMRRQLCAIAEDPTDAAATRVADALAEAGDMSQIPRLLGDLQAGRWDAFKPLAAMPLEDAGVSPAQLPEPPAGDDAEARLWHALAAARVGETRWIDSFVTGKEPEPSLFFGSPSTPYAQIASVRPLPEGLKAHLTRLLPQVESIADHARARMAQIVIGAATGVADEQGVATDQGDRAEAAPPSSQQRQDALVAARGFLAATTASRCEVVVTLGEGEVGSLVTQVLADATSKAAVLPAHVPANQAIGNAVVGLLRALPRAEEWPVRSLLLDHLHCAHPAIDDLQMAWVIAQVPPRRWIGEVSALLAATQRSPEERLRILRIAMATADHSAGHGDSPYRGAGGGSRGARVVRLRLIADLEQRREESTKGLGDELSIDGSTAKWKGVAGDSEKPTKPAPEPAADRDERRVNAVILQGGSKRLSFVAGRQNVIRCWIGLPEHESATADRAIPPISIPNAGLLLRVDLHWRDGSGKEHTPSGSMLLPAARTARGGDCDLSIEVPENERYVSAEILFRHRGRVFECVRVEGFALAPGDAEEARQQILVRVQARRRETIEIVDSQPVDATIVVGTPTRPEGTAAMSDATSVRVFGHQGTKGFDLRDADKAIAWLNETLATTEKVIVRRQAANKPAPSGTEAASQPWLDANDPDVVRLLRDMARHGVGLYNQLERDGFVDPGERIQVLNLEPETYVPLEFVYDRGYPRSEARLCTAGLDALRVEAAACPVCRIPAANNERGDAAVICPFGFWAIRKVIERIAPGAAAGASVPRQDRRGLPILDSVAFASSHRVPPEEIEATRTDLQQKFAMPFFANDWNEWRSAIEKRPSLLLLLPHHGMQAQLDYLEIGDEKLPEDLGKLSRSQLLSPVVNVDGRDPGPVVLLLGCRTAGEQETGYASITQVIQELRASIVLGTLAEVLGRHAAPVARELVEELVAIRDARTDFGTVMRRVRRRMLARGFLMALCLVAFGDAEWRVTPRPDIGPQ